MSAPAVRILASAPFPLTLRNFLQTGLVGALESRLDARTEFVSPYAQPEFVDREGRTFANHHVPSGPGPGGVPIPEGLSVLDRALKSIHLTGFALEYPDGSLQNIELSRRRNAQWAIARLLTWAAPRGSAARWRLRDAYARFRPGRAVVAAAFDRIRPDVVLVASPGHYWIDQFVLDEAARRGIPTVCVVLSWDNLYSRGPMARRPDRMLVWSEEMRRQAIEVHQYPAERIGVVGALQFVFYGTPVAAGEIAAMRARIGLGPDEPYLAYVCGARTSRYDVEDVQAMLAVLREGPHRGLRVVVRPHPQGSRETYAELRAHGVLLDESPDLTAAGARPEAMDVPAIRHMASLLRDAAVVVSSWGTTALLEACIVDTAAVQLRWMDAIPHAAPEEVGKVRDFQRYIHMRAFDATGARPYCDRPEELNGIISSLLEHREAYAARREATVERLVAVPLGGVVDRVCEQLEPYVARERAPLAPV